MAPFPFGVTKLPPTASALLAAGGLLVLGVLAWPLLQPDPPPYRYALVAEGGLEKFPALGLPAIPDLTIREYELRAAGVEEPLAMLHVGERGESGPVLLDWRNQLAEPLITITPPLTELIAVLEALGEHLPEDAMVLGWWDTTRRLALLGEIRTPFLDNLAGPLLVPAAWNDRREAVEDVERDFWRAPEVAKAEAALFEGFQEALLADPAGGAAKLRALAGGRDAYLVVHLSDAYKLGSLHPERFGIGYREFPNTGNMHTLIGSIKKWLREQGYENYTVEKLDATSVRVYFLTDAPSSEMLIAQALPFTSSQPMLLGDLKVVYQHGGYWVYKIPPPGKGSDT